MEQNEKEKILNVIGERFEDWVATIKDERFVFWLENWGKKEPLKGGSVCPNCNAGIIEDLKHEQCVSFFMCRSCSHIWFTPIKSVDFVHIDFIVD